jgi:phosphatidylcholine synthase
LARAIRSPHVKPDRATEGGVAGESAAGSLLLVNPLRENLLRFCAWLIHLYTASGAIVGLLALHFTTHDNFRTAFILMAVALFIDATDGPLARAIAIRKRVPEFDGSTLDNIVDYLNYVAVPAFLMVRAGLLVMGSVGLASAGFVMLASAYGFCRVDAKTADLYFRGFPSYWNLVVFYLFCLGWTPALNTLLVVALAILVFMPVKFIYPNRTVRMRALTLSLIVIWAIVTTTLLIELPRVNPVLLYSSLAFVVYYFVMSAILQVTSPGPGSPRV